MKPNAFLVCLLLVGLKIGVARAEDALVLDDGADTKITSNTMTWPVLPGESINALAAKFYPKNKVMQRLFTAKTLGLNAHTIPNLDANANFSAPTAVVIPTLKSLSYSTHISKTADGKQGLLLSQNLGYALNRVPRKLLDDYQNLVMRNNFLKEELAKINAKIAFLQKKLNNLKLIFDKTMSDNKLSEDSAKDNTSTAPQKKSLKNLDLNLVKPKEKPAPLPDKTKLSIDLNILLQILGFGLLISLFAYLLSLVRRRMNKKLLDKLNTFNSSTQTAQTSIKEETSEDVFAAEESAGYIAGKPLGAETMVGDLDENSILEEAKFYVSKNQPDEAIEHIKWSMRAQPKASLNLWMYLLDIYRQNKQREEFESHAKQMHALFNVMTPVWGEKKLEMVVANSLEEFPHIIQNLTETWPTAATKDYLNTLLIDNRKGERTGFSLDVTDEILLLVAVLDLCGDSAQEQPQ